MTTELDPASPALRPLHPARARYLQVLEGPLRNLPRPTTVECGRNTPITVYTALSRLIAARSRQDTAEGFPIYNKRLRVRLCNRVVSLHPVETSAYGDPVQFKPGNLEDLHAFLHLLAREKLPMQVWHLATEWRVACEDYRSTHPNLLIQDGMAPDGNGNRVTVPTFFNIS